MKYKKLALGVAIAVAGMSQAPVYATNGMLMIGSGFRSQSMGGTGIASGRDAVSVGANPANAIKTGMRGDMGVGIFNAERSATIDTDLGTGTFDFVPFGTVESDNKYGLQDRPDTLRLTEGFEFGRSRLPFGRHNLRHGRDLAAQPWPAEGLEFSVIL